MPAPWHIDTRARMKSAGLTQWDVANGIADYTKRKNFTQSHVQSALAGRTRPPLEVVTAWAHVLGLEGKDRDEWLASAITAHLPPDLAVLVERWRSGARSR